MVKCESIHNQNKCSKKSYDHTLKYDHFFISSDFDFSVKL